MSTFNPGTTAPAAPPALVAAPAPAAIPAAAPAAPQLFGQKAEIGTDEVSLSVKADKTAKGKAKSAAGKVGAFAKSTAGKVIGAAATVAAVAAGALSFKNGSEHRELRKDHPELLTKRQARNEAYDALKDFNKANPPKKAVVTITPVDEPAAAAPASAPGPDPFGYSSIEEAAPAPKPPADAGI